MGDPKHRSPLLDGKLLSQDEWHTVLREVLARAQKAEAEVERLRRPAAAANPRTIQKCIDALAQARRENDWRAVMVVERMLRAELAPSDTFAKEDPSR